MDLLAGILDKFESRHYEFSKHAVDQAIIRDVSVAELEEAISSRSEVIEDYPDDKFGPSCIVLWFTAAGRPLHVHEVTAGCPTPWRGEECVRVEWAGQSRRREAGGGWA